MPFLTEITGFIDTSLKDVLNKEKLHPQKFFGISTQIATQPDRTKPVELQPGIVNVAGGTEEITPDSRQALQTYHKLTGKTYAYQKATYGRDHDIVCTMDMQLICFTNSKLTGRAKEVLEPLFLFGFPQHLTDALRASLKLITCKITPTGSNLDATSVYRQEYPNNTRYDLHQQLSMFAIRYRVEISFNQSCMDNCLC